MPWKNKQEEALQDDKIILGMIMLQDEGSLPFDAFMADFSEYYSNKIDEPNGDETAAAFNIDGETVAIGFMPVPIPAGDIERTAQYAYNWVDAVEEVSIHKSHLIVSVMHGSNDTIKRFKIFTQVVCSLLRTTNALGVYMGSQSLLIPKEDYLNESAFMSEDYLPLNLWVYIGLQVSDQGNSGYTYGLNEFGKTELEVLDSSKSLEEIYGFLFNIAHYVLQFDVTFKDGQTCGLSEEEKIVITHSKGSLVEGETFKLAY